QPGEQPAPGSAEARGRLRGRPGARAFSRLRGDLRAEHVDHEGPGGPGGLRLGRPREPSGPVAVGVQVEIALGQRHDIRTADLRAATDGLLAGRTVGHQELGALAVRVADHLDHLEAGQSGTGWAARTFQTRRAGGTGWANGAGWALNASRTGGTLLAREARRARR